MHYIRTLCSFYVAVVTLSVSWTGCKPIAHDPTSHPPKTSKGGSAETLRTDPAARKNGKDNSSFPSHASNAEEHQGVISPDWSPVVTETDEIPLDEIPCRPCTPKNTPDAVARTGVISPDWSPVVTETDEIPLDEIPCSPFTLKNTPDAVAWTGVISPDELRSITRNLQRSMEKMSEADPDESFDRNALNRPNSTEERTMEVRLLDMLEKEMQREIDQVIQVIESQSYNLQQHHEKK
jgi:hypothetical protein